MSETECTNFILGIYPVVGYIAPQDSTPFLLFHLAVIVQFSNTVHVLSDWLYVYAGCNVLEATAMMLLL